MYSSREAPVVPVAGSDEQFRYVAFACVGRNYAARNAREMSFDPDREPPFFFYVNQRTLSSRPVAGDTWNCRIRPITTIMRK